MIGKRSYAQTRYAMTDAEAMGVKSIIKDRDTCEKCGCEIYLAYGRWCHSSCKTDNSCFVHGCKEYDSLPYSKRKKKED